eukprot:NODE_3115_length_2090_cov_8.617422.p1 GENE.NODE_3115_length_2090_cov_8.617422~~NODE_3115_length_2090_cov_8.617422.p1  ORF type:complete len:544 (+),score=133.44 NODE_3115_length_2090_cov_8.617422:84-1715(+)
MGLCGSTVAVKEDEPIEPEEVEVAEVADASSGDVAAGLEGITPVIEGEVQEHRPLCKMGCMREVMPGLTRSGRPFATCCKMCAMNPGANEHDTTCIPPEATATDVVLGHRPVCQRGARCRQREAFHLSSQAHPLDVDYQECCANAGVQYEELSLKILFDWVDDDGSGKLSREELQASMHVIARAAGWSDQPEDFPPISEAAWSRLDEDGNGVVNFSEFAAWAGPRLGLPLGMRSMMARASSNSEITRPCHVLGCPCEDFGGDQNRPCKHCNHKPSLHQAKIQTGEVPMPDYWDSSEGDKNGLGMVDMGQQATAEFQQLVTRTHRKVWTRDRSRHNPANPKVPKGYRVVNVKRNENLPSWREYAMRRAELMCRSEEADQGLGKVFEVFPDVKTSVAWREIGGPKACRLEEGINEWYLFHGTNPAAAESICGSDFKVSRAGSNTGTLYGRGLYFAESVTKADEYAKPNDAGIYAVLLCRVLGGHVLYTDEVTPDPEDLVHNCVNGDYDIVLGDREKCRNTFREFVLFDSEDVYPEYSIEYVREYE